MRLQTCGIGLVCRSVLDGKTDTGAALLLGAAEQMDEFELAYKEKVVPILDPEAVDARTKAGQQAKVEAFGGVDIVRSRGAFDNSTVHSEAPAFRTYT